MGEDTIIGRDSALRHHNPIPVKLEDIPKHIKVKEIMDRLKSTQKDIPPEFAKVLEEEFWKLL